MANQLSFSGGGVSFVTFIAFVYILFCDTDCENQNSHLSEQNGVTDPPDGLLWALSPSVLPTPSTNVICRDHHVPFGQCGLHDHDCPWSHLKGTWETPHQVTKSWLNNNI